MIAEIHILQSFGLSNLNRDDTGSPKDCVYGGTRRARISSQCLKRAVRTHEAFATRVKGAQGEVGTRTKKIAEVIASVLRERFAADEKQATWLSRLAVQAMGLKFDAKKPQKTQYLMYLGPHEIEAIAGVVASDETKTELLSYIPEDPEAPLDTTKVAECEAYKNASKELKSVVSKERLKHHATAADIALFGRMVADSASMNVDAACQVAHAISTHEVAPIIDYFTAVDDIDSGTEETGAGMVGSLELNSACYYRYATIDIDALGANLAFNNDVRDATILGFVEAMIKAVPTGKQNSTAAQNPPVAVRVVVRKDGFPWALTNAFSNAREIRPSDEESIEKVSFDRMNSYFDELVRMYGDDGITFDEGFSLFETGEKKGGMSALLEALAGTLSEAPTKQPAEKK